MSLKKHLERRIKVLQIRNHLEALGVSNNDYTDDEVLSMVEGMRPADTESGVSTDELLEVFQGIDDMKRDR